MTATIPTGFAAWRAPNTTPHFTSDAKLSYDAASRVLSNWYSHLANDTFHSNQPSPYWAMLDALKANDADISIASHASLHRFVGSVRSAPCKTLWMVITPPGYVTISRQPAPMTAGSRGFVAFGDRNVAIAFRTGRNARGVLELAKTRFISTSHVWQHHVQSDGYDEAITMPWKRPSIWSLRTPHPLMAPMHSLDAMARQAYDNPDFGDIASPSRDTLLPWMAKPRTASLHPAFMEATDSLGLLLSPLVPTGRMGLLSLEQPVMQPDGTITPIEVSIASTGVEGMRHWHHPNLARLARALMVHHNVPLAGQVAEPMMPTNTYSMVLPHRNPEDSNHQHLHRVAQAQQLAAAKGWSVPSIADLTTR